MPAEKAGIIAGEKLIAINDIKISSWEDIKPAVSKFEGEEITVTLRAKEQKKSHFSSCKNTNTGDIVIGVSQSIRIEDFLSAKGLKQRP